MTTLYNPSINSDPLALGFLAYGQIPTTPVYPFPLPPATTDVFRPIPSLLTNAPRSSNGVTLNTNGTVFNGIPGYNPVAYFLSNGSQLVPTGRTLQATSNTGYAGFTNYTLDTTNVTPTNFSSIRLQPVNPAFPTLDPTVGFTVAFNLAIAQESSNPNRAGFSVLVVSNDLSKAIELGFKEQGANSDIVFAQNANLNAASSGETSTVPLEISTSKTYQLTFKNNTYALSADGIQLLSGPLRDYLFNPSTSNPPFPTSANPYETKNLVFFGDNTDQGHATFTLGKVTVNSTLTAKDGIFNFQQFSRAVNALFGPFSYTPVEIGGLQFPLLYDETYYLSNNLDVANAVAAGRLASGYDHFTRFGWLEGRNPSTLFNEAYYLDQNPDVRAVVGSGKAFTSGFQHFALFGNRENRNPSALFNQSSYLATNPDVQAAVNSGVFTSGFDHWLEAGAAEGRSPELSLFKEAFYLSRNPDVAAVVGPGKPFGDGFQHFISFGSREGRDPGPLFSESGYLALNPDVAAAVGPGKTFPSGFSHYILTGRIENRPTAIVS